MKVLAVDSSTALLQIGLSSEGHYYELDQNIGLHHTEHLIPLIADLLEKAELQASDLDILVISKGPGSFTGLRIGFSALKGLAFGAGAPLVSVPTLDLLAYGKDHFPGSVVPLIDARKQRIYSAFFQMGERKSDYLDVTPASLLGLLNSNDFTPPYLFTGPDCMRLLPVLKELDGSNRFLDRHCSIDPLYASPSAWQLIQMGRERFERRGGDQDNSGPLYIRPSEAELSRGLG